MQIRLRYSRLFIVQLNFRRGNTGFRSDQDVYGAQMLDPTDLSQLTSKLLISFVMAANDSD